MSAEAEGPCRCTRYKQSNLLKTVDAMDSAIAKIERTWNREIFKFSQRMATSSANMFYVVDKFAEARDMICKEVESKAVERAGKDDLAAKQANGTSSANDESEVDVLNDKDTAGSLELKDQCNEMRSGPKEPNAQQKWRNVTYARASLICAEFHRVVIAPLFDYVLNDQSGLHFAYQALQ
ncbi:unnamed protein product [Toxocara canis]|uniref:DHC_N1 domain-containing protein n=1 Tax=Toxocara canis TaxID=6265 RepID=A0A183V8I8_TOXCA|nr:unnamed protein product [Toxocara canis]